MPEKRNVIITGINGYVALELDKEEEHIGKVLQNVPSLGINIGDTVCFISSDNLLELVIEGNYIVFILRDQLRGILTT